MSDVKTYVHVVYAGFGDAAILEFVGAGNKRRLYLVDGGPIGFVGAGKKASKREKKLTKPCISAPYYQYLLCTLTELGRIPDTNGIKIDGAVVTHPHADHLDGVERLFRLLLPQQYQDKVQPRNSKHVLICNGPVLLTKAFKGHTLEHLLLKYNFEASESSEDILNAFANEIRFTFPSSPGVVFKRDKPLDGNDDLPDEGKKRTLSRNERPSRNARREKWRPKSESSIVNQSSIILYSDRGGKICLCGDAYGCDIVQMLRKEGVKDLDIFKLPHHGSADNSNLGNVQPPLWAIHNLASMLLLSISLQQDLNQVSSQESKDIKHLRTRLEEITSEIRIQQVADALHKVLEDRRKLTCAALIEKMQLLHMKVVDAIRENNDKRYPCYNLEPLESLKEWDTLENSVINQLRPVAKISTPSVSKRPAKRRKFITVSTVVGELMGKNKMFKNFFEEKIGIVKFFESFHAKTYYVSSDGSYNHPSPQVINGIIKAAMNRKEQKPCRIVLTSGEALDAACLLDVNDAVYKGWNKVVPIYYLKEKVSLKLDPEEDINVVPKHAAKFKADETVVASVAQQLKKNAGFTIPNRSFIPEHDVFYVKTQCKKSRKDVWLDIREGKPMLFLTETSNLLRVSNTPNDVRAIILRSNRDDGVQKEIWLERGKGGFYIKESPDGNYVVEDGLAVKFSNDKDDGSLFFFENKFLTGTWGGDSVITLSEYLRSIAFQAATESIKVRDVLETLLGVPNVTTLTSQFNSDFIGVVALDQPVDQSGSSVKISSDFDVTAGHILVVLPTPTFQFSSMEVNKLFFVVKEPCSQSPKLQVVICSSVADTTIDVSRLMKERIPSVDMFLNELGGVSKDQRDKMTLGTLLTRVMGFSSLTSLANCLPSQLLESAILTWNVDRSLSTVEYFKGPLAVEVISGDIYVHIPWGKNKITFERTSTVEISKLHVLVKTPRTFDSSFHVECDALIGSVPVVVTVASNGTRSPEITIMFPDTFSLSEVSKILGLSDQLQFLSLPALNKVIKNLQLSRPSVTIIQDVTNSLPSRVSALSFEVSLDDWSSVLPAVFPSPTMVNASIHISSPLTANLQIGVEIDFRLPVISSAKDDSFLCAKLSVLPVGTPEQDSQEGHVLGISLKPSSSRISIQVLLDTVGGCAFGEAIASSFPCIARIMDTVIADDLSLEVNSYSKAINSMTLSLVVPEWNIFQGKFTMYDAKFLIQYAKEQVYVQAEATLLILDKYLCFATFSLPAQSMPGSLRFENFDSGFTLKEMIDGVGRGSVADIPVLSKVLDVRVSRVDITCENEDSSFRMTNSSVLVEKESLDIGRLTVSNLKLEVRYSNVPGNSPVAFVLQGFLNKKAFATFSYDAESKELLGSYKFVENSSTAECLSELFSKETEIPQGSSAFDAIKDLHVLEARVIISLPREEKWNLKEFVLDIEGLLSLGPFHLTRLSFHYSKEETEYEQQEISILGHFQCKNRNLSFVVEFACTGDNLSTASFKAVIRPDATGGLTLSALLSFLDLSNLELPPVRGAHQFREIELKEAVLQFKASPFCIEKLDIVVATSKTLVILEKPPIHLANARLEYHLDGTKVPAETTIYIAGVFSLAGIHLDVTLTKDANGGFLLEGNLEDSGHAVLDFQKAATELSPNVDVNLPKNVALTSFRFRVERRAETDTLHVQGNSQQTWSSDSGFATVTFTELGGQLKLQKTQTSDEWSGFVCLFGKVLLPGSVAAEVMISYDSKKDLIASGVVHRPAKVDLDDLTNNLPSSSSPTTSWKHLIPSGLLTGLRCPKFDSVSVHINLTNKTLLLRANVVEFGSGALVVKKAKADDVSGQWGFLFGLRLASDFKFSTLCEHLSPVDELLSVRHASLSVVSLRGVTIEEIREQFLEFQQFVGYSQGKDENAMIPFADLDIQGIQNIEINCGLTVFATLDIVGSKSELMVNMSQIQRQERMADVTLFAHISENIPESMFMAHIQEMELLGGCLTFREITFLYQPCNRSCLSLSGKMNLRLTEQSSPLVILGCLKITEAEANFSMGCDPVTIPNPFGMFGLSIEEAKLELTWRFDRDVADAVVPDYRVGGIVRILKSTSTDQNPVVAATLEGSILFQGGKPEVAMIALNPSSPLQIDDLFATLFGKQWPAGYLDVSFKGGEIYYARSALEVGGRKFVEGFNANTEIDIMRRTFGVTVSIDSTGIVVKGYTKPAIDLVIVSLTGEDLQEETGPEIFISRRGGETKFSLATGVILLQEKIGNCSVDYDVTRRCFGGEVKYKGELLGLKEPSITFEWSATDGFKIRRWPALLPLGTLIDFAALFEKLSEIISSPCEKLVNLAFVQVINTACRLKLSQVDVKDSPNPKAWIAFKLRGIFEIMIVTKEPSLTVDFPEMIVAVDKPKGQFKLSDLPAFLIEEILKNSLELAKQVFNQPEQLTKFFTALGFVKLSRKILSGLICRGVRSQNVQDAADIEEDMMQEEADTAEGNFDQQFEKLLGSAVSASLSSLASSGAFVLSLGAAALSALRAIDSFGGKGEDQKKTGKRQEKIKEKRRKVIEIVQDHLVVSGLSLVLVNDDELQLSWKPLEKGVQYRVQVICRDVSGKERTVKDVTTEANQVTVKGQIIKYNNTKIMAFVQASYTCDGETFRGKREEISHETRIWLFPPANVLIESKQEGMQLLLTFTKVEYATDYEAEVVSHDNRIIGKATISQPPMDQQGKHVFLATELSSEAPGNCQARVCSRRDGSRCSEFTDSGPLYRVDSPSDIHFSYKPAASELTVKWIVRDLKQISGYKCEVVSVQSKTVVYSKFVSWPKKEQNTVDHDLNLEEVTNRTQSPYFVRVCSLGGIATLASAFLRSSDHMSFLPPVYQVVPSYEPESSQLTVSWLSSAEASTQSVTLREKLNATSVVAEVTVDGQRHSAEFKIDSDNLKAEACYELVIVAKGSDTKHLPSDEAVSVTTLTALPIPPSIVQEYQFEQTQIVVTFQPVPLGDRHLIEVFNEADPSQVIYKNIVVKRDNCWPEAVSEPISVKQLKLCGGTLYKSRVVALGNRALINSSPRVSSTSLECSQPPIDVALAFNETTNSIDIKFAGGYGVFTAEIVDIYHQGRIIGVQEVPVNHTSPIQFALIVGKEPAGSIYQAFLQTIGDSKHLPSEVIQSNKVFLLERPRDVIQEYRSGVLTVFWTCVHAAAEYCIRVYNTTSSKVAIEANVPQGLAPDGYQLEKQFDVYSLALESNGVYQTSVTSLGDPVHIGGAITTSNSEIPSFKSPSEVKIKYDTSTHSLHVLCSPVSDAVLYMIGIVEDTVEGVSKVASQDSLVEWKEIAMPSGDVSIMIEGHFDVSTLIPSCETPYRGVAQVLADAKGTPSLPSGRCISAGAIPWLKKPSSIKLTFAPARSILKITWKPVGLALRYLVEVLHVSEVVQSIVASAEVREPPCNIDVSDLQIQDHDTFQARVWAIGDENVISFASVALSENSIGCKDSPRNPSIRKVEDKTVELAWQGTEDVAYEIVVWRISNEKIKTKHTKLSLVKWSPADLAMSSPGQYRMAVRTQGSSDKLHSRFSEFDCPVFIMEAPVVTVTEQSHAVKVQWEQVDNNLAKYFSHYIIFYQISDTDEWEHVTADLSLTETVVDHLEPDTEYSFSISVAHSDRGSGIRSSPTVIRTEPESLSTNRNLLQNPNFWPIQEWDRDGTTKVFKTEPWQVLWQGGNGYRLRKITQVSGGDSWCLTASTAWCWRVQVIDLIHKGFSPDFLDHVKPIIHVQERFATASDLRGGVCDIKVSLLDSEKRDLAGKNTVFYSGEIRPCVPVDMQIPDTWQLVERSFCDYPAGLRYIRFEDGIRSAVDSTRGHGQPPITPGFDDGIRDTVGSIRGQPPIILGIDHEVGHGQQLFGPFYNVMAYDPRVEITQD